MVGLRSGGETRFSEESFCPSTGSAIRWLCQSLKLFSGESEIEVLASGCGDSGSVVFVPSLAGIRVPRFDAHASGVLEGLRLETSRNEVARAVLEGIAHSVCDAIDALGEARGEPISVVRVGGGLAASASLLQIQADLVGTKVERLEAGSLIGIRGAGLLAGSVCRDWPSVTSWRSPSDTEFHPAIDALSRSKKRDAWRERFEAVDTQDDRLSLSSSTGD